MNGTTLQSRIYAGMGKAASKIGRTYDHYRPTGTTAVLVPSNKLGTLSAQFTASGSYGKPNSYGQATWQATLDGSQTQVGDYLDGPEGPFFIAAQQPLLPILAVSCTRTISVTQGGASAVCVGWPASVLLESTRGTTPIEAIPGNPSTPHWWCLLPAVSGLTFNVADLVTDDLGRTYVVGAAELTDLGWRISMTQTTQLTDSIVNHYATIIGLIGKVITLRKVTKGTGPNPTNTTTDYAVKALIQAYDISLIANSTVSLKDQRVIIGTKDTGGNTIPTPTASDLLVIDGATRPIGAVKVEYAGNAVSIYDVQAKG